MKFGSNLPRLQVPEWSSEYINYKGLKKLIKFAATQRKHDEDPDLAEFFFSLDRNLETVDGFYNKKYAETSRRLKLLQLRYGSDTILRQTVSKEEAEDLTGIVLELRNQLRNLQWYGEVNRRGFVKILKKKDKKLPSTKAQEQYLQTRVDPRPFALNAQLTQDVSGINTWLSRLGEIRVADDASETESSGSLSRTVTASLPSLPREILDEIDKSVREDNVHGLAGALTRSQEYSSVESAPSQKLLLHVLQRAISSSSQLCIAALLRRVSTLDEPDDVNKRNCVHRLVISIARARAQKAETRAHELEPQLESNDIIVPAEAPDLETSTFTMKYLHYESPLVNSHASVRLFQFLLDNLAPSQREVLVSRDSTERLPLHYAAKFGFTVLCEIIVDHMRRWEQLDISNGIDTPAWYDDEGNSPLHLSVLGGYTGTTQYLLGACRPDSSISIQDGAPRRLANSGNLLMIAVKSNHFAIISLLLRAGADVNAQDKDGETALHVAARFDYVESAQSLIAGQSVNLNIQEETYGWSAIHVASVDGHMATAHLLAKAGADIELKDNSGWTAKEHAALRGHIELSEFLAQKSCPITLPTSTSQTAPKPQNSSLSRRTSTASKEEYSPPRALESIKTFGHRYLKDESLILVSLGSMDQRKDFRPVALDNIPLKDAHTTQLDTALSIVVSAAGAKTNEPTIIDLPVKENISTDPILFTAKDLTKVKLLFDLVPTYAGSKEEVVGRAVALLSSVRPNIGSKRMNLQGDISVPIIASKTMDYIGTVNFNFLVITPFAHSSMSVNESQTYWKSMAGPMVIGHRGMGKNMPSRKSLQLGENTIQSFIAAANLGASYVEFDVQLTKDHVPVIYHDFLVSETGIDAPVHTLTLEQFLHVSESHASRASRHAPPGDEEIFVDGASAKPRKRAQRAHSLGAEGIEPRMALDERMKHTRDFKLKGYKSNSWGKVIREPFTTLEEMLRKLPQSIGFNIEMKYPMLFESEEEEMDTYAVELNSFVDTVLQMVYDHGKQRDIIFSSFNPDVCLLLSFKQPSIPILFLTDAGVSPVGDIRASSLQEAIRFASRWNLLGVVTAAEPLVTCPRLVRAVKESGLVCVSYGTLNNDPENVKLQANEGIDAVIVDSVLAIRKGLTHSSPKASPVNDNLGSQMIGAAAAIINPRDDQSTVEDLALPKTGSEAVV